MKTNYRNLQELKNYLGSGKLQESKLSITLDNDQTLYYYDDDSEDGIELIVESAGNGYSDYYELYEILFPESEIQGC
jgi:hypothetical protein